jgi:hypothetical protein
MHIKNMINNKRLRQHQTFIKYFTIVNLLLLKKLNYYPVNQT